MRREQLKEYCEAEFENIESVLAELASLVAPGKLEYSTAELAAMATFIHNCYNGVENVLKRILIYESKGLPDSATWHKDLLEMAAAKGIIDESLHERLLMYLSFRHFFVHAYSFALKWKELKPLAEDIAETVVDFKTATSRYVKNL
jgi:hypothetical protein